MMAKGLPTATIVVPDDFPAALTGSTAESALRGLGDVRVYTERGADDQAELIRRIGDADAVLNIRAYARFTDEVLASCSRLRLISIWGTGVDHVDIEVCRRRGVTVATTPGVNADAVAEHTIALMLALMRRIPINDRDVRAGGWPRGLLQQAKGKTLGVVGFGAIGSRVAEVGQALGMAVVGFSFRGDVQRIKAKGTRPAPLEEVLQVSDVVSLHLRLTSETRGLLGSGELGMMKATAFLVNTARAALVEHQALVAALKEGRLAGAAVDVFHQEPVPPDDPLLSLPNVVVTPHNSGMVPEVIEAGLQRAVENIGNFLQGRPTGVL